MKKIITSKAETESDRKVLTQLVANIIAVMVTKPACVTPVGKVIAQKLQVEVDVLAKRIVLAINTEL